MKEYSSEKDLYILAKELAYKFTLDKYKTFLIQHELIQKDILDEPFGRFSKIIVKEEYIRETLIFLWPGEKFDELIEILYGEEITTKPIGFESISKQVTPKSKDPDNITKSIPAVHRKLRVFLCHSSQDKPIVRELYQRLSVEGWIDPWLDEEKLLPGQDWDLEIEKAVESSDAVIVFLSKSSVSKEGYVQKELRKVLDIALEKPEETIFIIPVRLEDCELPRRLRARHYVDYFPAEKEEQAFQRLLQALNVRFGQLNPQNEDTHPKKEEPKPPKVNIYNSLVDSISAKGNGTVDTAGTIPLILYFSLAALSVLANSDSTIQFMVGIFAVLAGFFLLIRKQMPPTFIFKISTLLFLVLHALNETTEIPYGEVLEGIAALISCGSAIVTVRAPKKPVFYSSISLALFLFIFGVNVIMNAFGAYPSFFSTLVPIISIITIVLMVMDL